MGLYVQSGYALRTLMFLAVRDGHHSIAEGFVESVRGRGGGLKLARSASALNVGSVFRVMEDTGSFVECFDAETNTCVVTPACGLRHALSGALEAFARHLDQFTIADLVPDLEGYALLLGRRKTKASTR